MKLIDITGLTFGRLTVISKSELRLKGRPLWLCSCQCGGTKSVLANRLKSGNTLSCGCINAEKLLKIRTIHGMSDTPEYITWVGMKTRCTNKQHIYYKYYGGSGITVCKEWDSFQTFFNDMGFRPSSEHSLDRIDNTKGYSASNCRWATRKEQMRNTRRSTQLIYKEKIYTSYPELAEAFNINESTLWTRIKRYGFSVEKAITVGI